jgi:hypothetical protein
LRRLEDVPLIENVLKEGHLLGIPWANNSRASNHLTRRQFALKDLDQRYAFGCALAHPTKYQSPLLLLLNKTRYKCGEWKDQ